MTDEGDVTDEDDDRDSIDSDWYNCLADCAWDSSGNYIDSKEKDIIRFF